MASASRWTIALNTNRNVRSVIVITIGDDLLDRVKKAAQAKLRVPKKATIRIFLASTGQELIGSDVPASGDTLLLSYGKDFIGNVKPAPVPSAVSIVNLAERAYVDEIALQQLKTTAESLPGIVHAVGQPDLHPGN
ncbi:hypothetical protein IAU60_002550 [Kwoniella sp. DSM 27419]